MLASRPEKAKQEAIDRGNLKADEAMLAPSGRARKTRSRRLLRLTPSGNGHVGRQPHSRLGRDRRDHQLHQHVQSLGDAGRRAAGQEGRGARALDQALGQGEPGAGVEGGDRLPAGRPGSTPTSMRSGSTWSATAAPPASATRGRLPRRSPRPSRRTTWWPSPCSAATATSRAGSTPTSGPITWPRPPWSSPMPWPAPWISTSPPSRSARTAGPAGLPQGHLAQPARDPGSHSQIRSYGDVPERIWRGLQGR